MPRLLTYAVMCVSPPWSSRAGTPSAADLSFRLDGLESYVIEHSVKLLLVDSIANPARKQNSTLMERQDM